MSGSKARLQAIEAVKGHEGPAGIFSSEDDLGEIFGENVFTQGGDAEAAAEVGLQVACSATIEHGAPLDPAVADAVASAMKDWALEKGATHYAHVFYPLTGLTAEKHDSFLEPDRRRRGARRVRRQDPDPGRARRVELPERRPAQHLRGPRLHRLGRHQPGLRPGEPERQHAVHPDGVRLDDR